MDILIILIIVLVVVLVIAGTVYALKMNREAESKKRVMETIQGRHHVSTDNIMDEAQQQNKRRAEIAKKLKENKADEEKGGSKKTTLNNLIQQAGLSISPAQFWIFSVISMVVFVILAKFTGQSNLVLGLAAVIGLLGFPRFVLKKKAAKRQKEFLQEFPDALEATVRLLKAGMPVSEAIAMISKEYDGPVGDEMGRIYDKQKIGIPMHEAAYEACKRMPLTEMQMFATGLAIQAQTGSSLSEVLMNLSSVIRSRFRLKRKVKALSSEAIASASIIAALPILVASGLYFMNYEYISVLFTDPFGQVLLTGAIVWMGVGVLIMKTMINFKI